MLLETLNSPVPHPPRLLEVHEVAFILKCSQETVFRLIRAGKLPAIRLGTRNVRVHPHDLQAFIDAQRGKAIEQGIAHGERAIDRALESAGDLVRTLRPPA